jgi:hypothetical protein
MRPNLYVTLFAIFLLVACQRVKDTPEPAKTLKLEGYWKLKSYTVDPPLAGGINNLSSFLDPCALQVTYYFRPDGKTMFVDASDACKANSNGVDLDNEPVSKWEFVGEKLIISNDYSSKKDEFEYKKIDANTMTWTKQETIPLAANLGGNQKLMLTMTFVRVAK